MVVTSRRQAKEAIVKRRGRKAFGTREWEDAVYEHVSTHGQVEGEIPVSYTHLRAHET